MGDFVFTLIALIFSIIFPSFLSHFVATENFYYILTYNVCMFFYIKMYIPLTTVSLLLFAFFFCFHIGFHLPLTKIARILYITSEGFLFFLFNYSVMKSTNTILFFWGNYNQFDEFAWNNTESFSYRDKMCFIFWF